MPKKNPKRTPIHVARVQRKTYNGNLTKLSRAESPVPNYNPADPRQKSAGKSTRQPKSINFSTPFSFANDEEYAQYFKAFESTRNAQRRGEIEYCCFDCTVDAYLHGGVLTHSHDHPSYSGASPGDRFLYLYGQVYAGINRFVPDITLIYSGKKVRSFFTETMPDIIQDAEFDLDMLKITYEKFSGFTQFLEDQGKITREFAVQVREELGSYDDVLEVFTKNLKKAKNLTFEPTWLDDRTTIPPEEYERRFRKETRNPKAPPLSKFEYELAESIRKGFASIAIKNGAQFVHHKNRILEMSVSYASYAYWLTSEIIKQHLSISRLGEIWSHFIQRWGGLDFFAKNSVHLFPEDTVQTIFDITVNFLKKSCKRCDYRCLRKFVRPDSMQMPAIAPIPEKLESNSRFIRRFESE